MIPSPITVFGGAGFVGRYIVQALAKRGARVRVACRAPARAGFLKPMGDVGQITLVAVDMLDRDSLAAAVAGSQAVVNAVGILFERGRQTFPAIHVRAAEHIAAASRADGVDRLIHISAIGADPHADALYARSKGMGEGAVKKAFRGATIIRPSVIFGREDEFFNRFAALAQWLPALPLIGGGRTLFQPVYVGDVAEAVARCLEQPNAASKTYELGGPERLDFKALMERVLEHSGRRRLLVPVPTAIAQFQASFLEWLPTPPLTRDQVRLLANDNVVAKRARSLATLGIEPTPIAAVVPGYLSRFRPGGPRRRPQPA